MKAWDVLPSQARCRHHLRQKRATAVMWAARGQVWVQNALAKQPPSFSADATCSCGAGCGAFCRCLPWQHDVPCSWHSTQPAWPRPGAAAGREKLHTTRDAAAPRQVLAAAQGPSAGAATAMGQGIHSLSNHNCATCQAQVRGSLSFNSACLHPTQLAQPQPPLSYSLFATRPHLEHAPHQILCMSGHRGPRRRLQVKFCMQGPTTVGRPS